MSEVITGIGELFTGDPERPRMYGAAVVLEKGRIAWVGESRDAPAADVLTDAGGRAVLPGWVDSHTHLIFAGDRSTEFARRLAGEPYEAGGINVTVDATRRATLDELVDHAERLRLAAQRQGTTFLETKTGYGLDLDSEVHSARAARRVADTVTYLGAHVVPPGADRREYIDLVAGSMLHAVSAYVDSIDVFCERGAFDVEESREILRAGVDAGLRVRVHGNQLGHSGGVALAVEMSAASVDHCNFLSADDIDALAGSHTVATLLPACDLSTRQPFGPARELLDAGASVALATNCNPGTSFTIAMPYVVTTAVLQMHMTVNEAIIAATLAAARSLGRDDLGKIETDARADIQMLDAPSVDHLAYRPGMPLTRAVWREGVRVV